MQEKIEQKFKLKGQVLPSFPLKYIKTILFLYERQSDALRNEFISLYCSVLKVLLAAYNLSKMNNELCCI